MKRLRNFKMIIIVIVFIPVWINLWRCSSFGNTRIGQENAVWTESIFLRGFNPTTYQLLTEDYVKKYAETLKQNNIKYAYLFAGPFNNKGFLPGYAFSDTALNTVILLKRFNPDIVILPWVGGVQDVTVHLEDSVWRNNALQDSKRLINRLNVSGIHFDFEYVLEGNSYLDQILNKESSSNILSYGENVIYFHRLFRELMPTVFVSSVVVAPTPDTKPWKKKTSMDELRILTKYIDQISLLYYDTSLDTQQDFETNCMSLLFSMKELKIDEPDVQYLVSIGTFINELELQQYRNLNIENIPNSLQTLKVCLRKINSEVQIIDGISIYCNWETDEDEWKLIRKYWTRK